MGALKEFLKSKLLIFKVRNRFSAAVQIGQRQLYLNYQQQKKTGDLPGFNDTGFRVFSQFEEDGKLLFIFSIIGMQHKTFLEIGSKDGVNSNSANLAFNFDYHGLFIDYDLKSIKRGRKFYAKYPHPWMYQPTFVHSKVTAENINETVEKAGFKGEIDLLSIDIDGNDYWIWNALEAVSPRVVIIETQIAFGLNNIVVPYDANYAYPGKHPTYHGASPTAMVNLGKKKGYRLVGANQLGYNLIFVKNGYGDDELPEVSAQSILQHPYAKSTLKQFEPIKEWDYITP